MGQKVLDNVIEFYNSPSDIVFSGNTELLRAFSPVISESEVGFA